MPNNLPLLRTSFVGRTEELQTIEGLIGDSGLLTLSGAGGSGKTRLMREYSRRLIDRLPDGVWWVDLAPVSAPENVAPAIASSLQIGQQADQTILVGLLEDHLRSRSLALLLDNCEHLIDAVGELVDRLTSACPGLLVLVTSREPLHVAGEVVYPVRPLGIEEEAVALFVERARAVQPDLVFGTDERRLVQDICERLDGMPLAIELAAPWVRMMSLVDLRGRLADRFALLVGETRGVSARQRTLLATVDWSHDRLSSAERTLFRKLAVFSGSFSLAAVEGICADDGLPSTRTLNVLSRLCDQSMVVAEQSMSVVRYRLLETMREYGLERLREAGEEDTLRRSHFEFFLERAEAADDRLRKTGSDVELMALVPDLDNMRSALRWSIEADPDGAVQLAGALDHLWTITVAAEGRRWLEDTLARAPSRSKARARALAATVLPAIETSWPRAGEWAEESLEISTELGDDAGRAWALHILGLAAWIQGELAIARDYLSQALPLHERLGNAFATERTLHMLGCTLINIPGGVGEGTAHLARARDIARELHDRWAEQYASGQLAYASMDIGDLPSARAHLKDALACGDQGTIVAVPLAGMARVVADQDPVRAASLLAAARALNERAAGRSVFHLPYWNHARAAETFNAVEQSLDPERLRRAWDRGVAMSTEEAIAYAVEAGEHRPAENPGGLTPREVEIVRLVADGLGNKEIAGRLYVSVRTVEAHLDHVFTKLHLNSRLKLANWARETGLTGANADLRGV